MRTSSPDGASSSWHRSTWKPMASCSIRSSPSHSSGTGRPGFPWWTSSPWVAGSASSPWVIIRLTKNPDNIGRESRFYGRTTVARGDPHHDLPGHRVLRGALRCRRQRSRRALPRTRTARSSPTAWPPCRPRWASTANVWIETIVLLGAHRHQRRPPSDRAALQAPAATNSPHQRHHRDCPTAWARCC